jgi:hypothetical protein
MSIKFRLALSPIAYRAKGQRARDKDEGPVRVIPVIVYASVFARLYKADAICRIMVVRETYAQRHF